MQRILQSKIFLGLASFLVVLSGVLFVLTPTRQVNAQASIEMHRDRNGIVIFGQATLNDGGDPVDGLDVSIGVERERRHRETMRIIDRSTTDDNGQYKLWVNSHELRQLRHNDLVIMVTPDNQTQYEQTLDLESGDVALINIKMRTPLIPIFPLTVFVY